MPPLLPEDDTPQKRGEYYNSGDPKFLQSVVQFLTGEKTAQRAKAKPIVLSDVMSGDARLLSLYAAKIGAPIIYIRELSKLTAPDFLEKYMQDVGVSVYKMALVDSQTAYNNFVLKGVGFRKGAKLTEEIANVLKRKDEDSPNVSKLLTRKEFKNDLAQRLPFNDKEAQRKLINVVLEEKPIVVVWTKSVVSGGYWKGHPEHLLGKTGARQIAALAKKVGFKVAVAGDSLNVAHLNADHDLRYQHGGLLQGLSMKEQYGAFHYINQHVPLIHVGMRSGNLEPLPVLGNRTIYLEELGNNQAARMQKLEAAIPKKYTRHMFVLPPTLKGRLRELATYFYNWHFQQLLEAPENLSKHAETEEKELPRPPESLSKHAVTAGKELQRLMVQLVRALDSTTPSNYTYEQFKQDKERKGLVRRAFEEAGQSDQRFLELKTSLAEGSSKGFMEEDLKLMKASLENEMKRAKEKILKRKDRYNASQADAAVDWIFADWDSEI